MPSIPHNLTAPLTPLVGRESEVAELLGALERADCRLLTIRGVGGVGKTRLALHLGIRLLSEQPGLFADGVFYVGLADLQGGAAPADMVAISIAQTLGLLLTGSEPPLNQLGVFLRSRALLLILDSFEQLIAGAACLAHLLEAAPALKILVTSRERLHLRGEVGFALDGLALPDLLSADAEAAGSDAVRLFATQAAAANHTFALDTHNLAPVVQICRLVDGLPLGIELAAAWSALLSPDEIAREIGRSLDFLHDAAQDLPPRHRGLRAVFAHSWAMLSPAEQQILCKLAVFQGSFTLEAAATIAGASLTQLSGLALKSLVGRVAAQAVGGEGRYRLHAVLRQYAAEELEASGEGAAVAAAHARFYLRLLADARPALRGGGQIAALAALSDDLAQIRAAWHWALRQRAVAELGAAAPSLFQLFDMRSWFAEGAELFRAAAEALAEQAGAQAVYGTLLARQGWFIFQLGRQVEAQALLSQSVALLRAQRAGAELLFALNYLAAVGLYLGEELSTFALAQESLALANTLGDAYGRAVASNILGQAAYSRGEYAAAREWSQQSLAVERQIGNRWSESFSLFNLAKVAFAQGDYQEARRLLGESMQIREQLGDLRGEALCNTWLGDVAQALGDLPAAQAHFSRSLTLFRQIGNQWGLSAALLKQGQLAIRGAHPAEAAPLLREALRLALETQSLPQMLAIFGAFGELARTLDYRAQADELARLAEGGLRKLAEARPLALQLLAWESVASAPPSLSPASTAQPGRGARVDPGTCETLTARELDVLRLLAEGLTDIQIAERLVISRRTVNTHLMSIYGKLQVNTRSAATRVALERGLV